MKRRPLPPVRWMGAAVLALLLPACGRTGDAGRPREAGKLNVVLISIDTLRADRLGCYGFAGVRTPAIDDLARRGVRFERCVAQTPLTLPSHTTLLTGMSPIRHGVRDNGGFFAAPELRTLAEVFKDDGYRTGAVVGAYVLDSKWGLDQGFDSYFDRFDTDRRQGFSVADVQRRAGEVIDEAVRWLGEKRDGPFFLFLHLYDPHTPYDPPPPFREEYQGKPYLGEIAYADAEVGRLMRFLANEGLEATTAVVLCSDHGESLGEHGEDTHGFFVYEETVRVPLIVAGPAVSGRGVVRPETVSLSDVMPTILDLAGLPRPPEVEGRSLAPLIGGKGGGEAVAYSETFYPRFHYGWNEVKSYRAGNYKLILSPGPELYDLAADPEESRDLAAARPDTVADLEKGLKEFERLAAQGRKEAEVRPVDAETREKLASLGYVGAAGAGAAEARGPLPSPRDKIGLYTRMAEAKELNLRGKVDEARRLLRQVIAEDPRIVDAYFVLGSIALREKEHAEAVAMFSKALELKPDYDIVALDLAIAWIEQGDYARGEKVLSDFVRTFPADSILFLTLGEVNLRQDDHGEAVRCFEDCLARNPRSAQAHNHLARTYILMDDAEKALAHAREAEALDPGLKNLRLNLAQIHEMRGETGEAEEDYLAELAAHPDNAIAAFNLGLLYRGVGENGKAVERLEQALGSEPGMALAHLFLGEVQAQTPGSAERAVSHLEDAVRLGLDAKHLRLAYYWLAKTNLGLGRKERAAGYARKLEVLKGPG
jgi:arylsulfatase A-like enzyme/predicted Zn-dependent protease